MQKSLQTKALDDLNRAILTELQKDARLPAVEIGRREGLSAPAVADRIQKLQENGYIRGYQTRLDFDKLGYTVRAFVQLRTGQLKHVELIGTVEAIPELVEWYTITGHYSIMLKIAAPSSERLAKIIEHLENFGETNTSLILSTNEIPLHI